MDIMKTAMQELIEILQKAKEESLQDCKQARKNGEDSRVDDTEFSVLSYVVKKATELLELEKNQLKDAANWYAEGCGCGRCDYCIEFGSEIETGEDYYNETFQK